MTKFPIWDYCDLDDETISPSIREQLRRYGGHHRSRQPQTRHPKGGEAFSTHIRAEKSGDKVSIELKENL